ncbi:GGDEF domain-containing protein [Pseudocolwellia agarivorans]|uniref:GGDEF domain-containing protein n=1 Tax=Pseudocolwellia agarivorans TaxID=1911682 RepID=UPI000984A6AE|nr:bifunctional diguanylate cyclase/phosphodiesterase [Pseudocolwellia agarivorans]
MKKQLQTIIENEQLTALFQPIYNTKETAVYGYEALIRGPSDSPLHSPQALFDEAVNHGLLSELELVCRRISIARFVELQLKGKLFLNVSPMVFLQSDHPQAVTLSYLKEHNLSPEQVVIELSEKYPIDASDLLQTALLHYRNLGFQIAVDDLGAGYAGLKLWSEVKPDYVKIDRYFINQCDQDPIKREFIKSILNLGQSINAKVVAEGIETQGEFEQLEELGLSIYQGFLFARPALYPPLELPVILKNRQRSQLYPVHFEQVASSLLQNLTPLSHNELTKNVVEYLHKNPKINSIPVVKDHKPIGMILRDHILELFSTPYGRALNEKKPVVETMLKNPVIVDVDARLDEVAQMVTSEHNEKLLWHFILTQKDKYIGIGSVRDLLRQLTQLQLQHARYANPLSLLPGNVPIYRHVDKLISCKQNFHFAYFDLNNFKPYNDQYGYAKGDQIIQLVANLVQLHCQGPDFVGHIGGDDFVAVFQGKHWRSSCEKILEDFDQQIKQYYTQEHLLAGGIKSQSRTGELQFYPLLSLAVGIVEPNLDLCLSHHDIAEMATAAKKQAKQATHSSIFVCQRGAPSYRIRENQKKKVLESVL